VGFRDKVLVLKSFEPEEIEEVAEQLGVRKEALFLKVSDAMAKPITLDHINMVEDPAVAGKPVVVEGQVSSTSVAYLVPKSVKVLVQGEEHGEEERIEEIPVDSPFNLKLIGVNEDIKYRHLKRLFGNPSKARIVEEAYRTIYYLKVRPPVFSLKQDRKIVDEKGFEYKAFEIYVVSDRSLTFEPGTLVRFTAKPYGSPKTQKTVLLAHGVEFVEAVEIFNLEKLQRLKRKLDGLGSVKAKVRWILENFERFSGIVGRRNLAYAGLLTFFSPTWVELDGKLQRGWVITLLIGDSTTGKSETVLKLISLLKHGMFITAETASQVGLTGAAVQIEKEGWLTEWGFLVLQDRKLLAIDGYHKLPTFASAGVAEAERQGVVTIGKAAKDRAYARTRQIKIANPLSLEAGRFETKEITSFLYPAQAVPTVLDKTNIARLDLAVFASGGDVKPWEVNVKMEEKPEGELELLSEALKWCWSETARVEITDVALEEILRSATELYNTFHTPSVPLVSIDIKWKLTRLSIALAYLTLSTDDFTTVKVTAEHVREVVDFLKDEYVKAGLNTMAQEERYEVPTSEDVDRILSHVANQADMDRETLETILKFIVLRGRVTKDQLQAQFNLADKGQLRPLLSSLQNDKLIRRGNGFYPTPQLIQLYKVLEQTRLPRLPGSEKNPPKFSKTEEEVAGKNIPPSFPGVANVANVANLDHEARNPLPSETKARPPDEASKRSGEKGREIEVSDAFSPDKTPGSRIYENWKNGGERERGTGAGETGGKSEETLTETDDSTITSQPSDTLKALRRYEAGSEPGEGSLKPAPEAEDNLAAGEQAEQKMVVCRECLRSLRGVEAEPSGEWFIANCEYCSQKGFCREVRLRIKRSGGGD